MAAKIQFLGKRQKANPATAIAFRPNGLLGKRLKRKGAAELYRFENQLVTSGLALGMEAEMIFGTAM